MKLLIVDDNPEMRLLLRQLCANVATDTRDCADGSEAVLVFDQFQPDWTLMDLMMPRMDGLTATRQILAAHPKARIIMLTQCRGPEYVQAASEAGARALVFKENLQPLLALLAEAAPPRI